MKRILLALLRQYLFWILFFNLTRLVFLVYYLGILRAEDISFIEVLAVFPHALKLDTATACYLLVLPLFILVIQSVKPWPFLNVVNKIYTGLMVAFYSLTAVGEMGIYAEWKTKLTYKVVKYLSRPDEIYNSSETWIFFLLLFLWIGFILAGHFGYKRWFFMRITESAKNLYFTLAFFTVASGLLFIGLRGGVQQIPINQSESYFSEHNILNLAAVNNGFNLYLSIFENLGNFKANPYRFMPSERARQIVDGIYKTNSDTTVHILNCKRPNIVMIILESWSADLIESLGGEPGITPEFRKFEKDGLLFEEIYSSGSRSEQGMASIFSGFPSHPISSVTVQPDKIGKLPSLPKQFEDAGYSTAFYFGGQLIYGNIKSYMMYLGFDEIVEGKDFPASIPRGKLGIHDEFTLDYMLTRMKSMRSPFFATLFTVSTHSPWDQPYPKPLKWGDNEREYINAALYTDHCLGEFLTKARREVWYDSTLFVFVADHSHNSYRNWHPQSKEYHRIPMLFYGEVLRPEFRGARWPALGNQHDIASTLLAQLDLPASGFRYSKNLFNPLVPQFAYYSTEDGVGWIRPGAYFTYERGGNYYYDWTRPETPDSVRNEGKAYLQVVFEDYMGEK